MNAEPSQSAMTPHAQVVAIVAATLFSLAYGLSTQYYFVTITATVPWEPFWTQVAAMFIVTGTILAAPGLRGTMTTFAPWLTGWWDKIARQHGLRLQVISLFVVTIQCAILLGYFTLFTGGALVSPYAQALLALALLSPQVARNKETVVAMLVLIGAVYAFFGFSDLADRQLVEVPDMLLYTTTMVTAIIALYYPLFGKQETSTLDWKLLRPKDSVQN